MAKKYVLTVKVTEDNGNGDDQDEKPKESEASLADKATAFFVPKLVQSVVSQGLNYVTSNVGMYTGSSFKQDQVNKGLYIFNKASDFATSVVMGGLTFGVTGAVLAGVTSLVSTGVEIGMQLLEESYNRGIENVRVGLAQARAGASDNRSRLDY